MGIFLSVWVWTHFLSKTGNPQSCRHTDSETETEDGDRAESTWELVSYNMRHDATVANKTPESSREQSASPFVPVSTGLLSSTGICALLTSGGRPTMSHTKEFCLRPRRVCEGALKSSPSAHCSPHLKCCFRRARVSPDSLNASGPITQYSASPDPALLLFSEKSCLVY